MIPFNKDEPVPGVYDTITASEYHRVLTDVVSNSYLGRLEKCPAKAKILDEETPTLMFGRALHSFVLTPYQFASEFAAVPDEPVFRKNKNTNLYKDAMSEFMESNIGRQIVSADDMDTIKNMADAIFSNPRVRELLTGGRREHTVVWREEETGIYCKARPDLIPDGAQGVVIDLKTTKNASPHPFQTSVVQYGYARQGAMMLHGLQKATGIMHDLFALVAVEPEPPHRTEVYALDDDFLKYGYAEYRRLLRIEKHCRDQKLWPAFTPANLDDLRQASFHTMLMPGYLSPENIPWKKTPEGV